MKGDWTNEDQKISIRGKINSEKVTFTVEEKDNFIIEEKDHGAEVCLMRPPSLVKETSVVEEELTRKKKTKYFEGTFNS